MVQPGRFASALCCVLLSACVGGIPAPGLASMERSKSPQPPSVAAEGPLVIESSLVPMVTIEGLPRETLEQKMARLGVAQLSVAVYRKGALAWAKAYGAGADGETLFQAASMSKLVAATGIAMLAKERGWSLDADISADLQPLDLARLNPGGVPITLRGLLSHTNGATVAGFDGYVPGASLPSTLDVVTGAAPSQSPAVRIEADKAGSFVYSGGGFQIAQLWAEQISGEPFASLMRRLILAPLGMRRSSFDQPLRAEVVASGNIAPAYTADGAVVEGRWHVYPEQASAGLWTTPTDYGRFLMALTRAAQGDRDAVLDPELVAQVILPVANQYGLGVEVASRGGMTVLSHAGGNEGYRCYFEATLETGDAIVSMSGSPPAFGLNADIVRTARRAYAWPGPEPQRATRVALSDAALAAFEGRYPLPDGQRAVQIKAEPPYLMVISPSGARARLVPISVDRFIDPDDAQEVRFASDGAGGMSLLVGEARLSRDAAEP